jgi:hypothetical protein
MFTLKVKASDFKKNGSRDLISLKGLRSFTHNFFIIRPNCIHLVSYGGEHLYIYEINLEVLMPKDTDFIACHIQDLSVFDFNLKDVETITFKVELDEGRLNIELEGKSMKSTKMFSITSLISSSTEVKDYQKYNDHLYVKANPNCSLANQIYTGVNALDELCIMIESYSNLTMIKDFNAQVKSREFGSTKVCEVHKDIFKTFQRFIKEHPVDKYTYNAGFIEDTGMLSKENKSHIYVDSRNESGNVYARIELYVSLLRSNIVDMKNLDHVQASRLIEYLHAAIIESTEFRLDRIPYVYIWEDEQDVRNLKIVSPGSQNFCLYRINSKLFDIKKSSN